MEPLKYLGDLRFENQEGYVHFDGKRRYFVRQRGIKMNFSLLFADTEKMLMLLLNYKVLEYI